MGSFQGHQVGSLLGEVFCAIIWLIPVYVLIKANLMPKIGKGMKVWDYLLAYIILFFIPNSTYAMFELRHLLFLDHIADNPNIWSYVVFGGISLIGLITTFYGTRRIIVYYAKSKRERLVYSSTLSLACGLGAAAGMLNFASTTIFFPPALVFVALKLLAQPILICFGLICAFTLFLINIFIDLIFKPSPNLAPLGDKMSSFRNRMRRLRFRLFSKASPIKPAEPKPTQALKEVSLSSWMTPAQKAICYPFDMPKPPSEPE